jgi:hypothetical protein
VQPSGLAPEGTVGAGDQLVVQVGTVLRQRRPGPDEELPRQVRTIRRGTWCVVRYVDPAQPAELGPPGGHVQPLGRDSAAADCLHDPAAQHVPKPGVLDGLTAAHCQVDGDQQVGGAHADLGRSTSSQARLPGSGGSKWRAQCSTGSGRT